MSPTADESPLLDEDYQRLLAFRSELREFLRWSEQTASHAGLTPSLHQLLLVIRGHPTTPGPTIGQAAQALHVRHHSVVELALRAEHAGLISRERDPLDQRRMHLELTDRGRQRLESLTRAHLPRIQALAGVLDHVLQAPRAAR
jgi:DNA-binding MarR family transcriptional regulator